MAEMTPDELRELDAEIHERVMGHAPRMVRVCGSTETILVRNYPKHCSDGEYSAHELRTMRFEVPRYSTDIAAAWLVVEKLRERRWPIEIGASATEDYWYCQIAARLLTIRAAETAALAICKAALAALEG